MDSQPKAMNPFPPPPRPYHHQAHPAAPARTRRGSRTAVAIALLVLATNCGSPQPVKWNAQLAKWFQTESIKPIAPPYGIWTEEDERLFYQQLGHANAVAVGRIRLVRLHSRHSQPHHIAVLFDTTEALYGPLEELQDAEGDLVLSLERGSRAFQRALAAQKRLPNSEFLLLLKQKPPPKAAPRISGWRSSLWRSPPKPPPRLAWAIYLPDTELLEQLRTLYRDLDDNGP